MNKKRNLKIFISCISLAFLFFRFIFYLRFSRPLWQFPTVSGTLYVFLNALVTFLMSNFLYIAMTIASIVAVNKMYKVKLDKNDLKKYEGYYRDILKEYTPAVLSYIDDFKIEETDVIGTLMNLEKNGYISSTEKSIKVINDDMSNLNESEKYVLQLVIDKNLKNVNLDSFENCVVEDCKNLDLLSDPQKDKLFSKDILKTKTFYLLFIGAFILMATMICPSISDDIKSLAMGIYMVIFVIIGLISFIKTFSNIILFKMLVTSKQYVRNPKATKLNENLEGLKNYINDFSLMSEKSKEDIKIWDDYLIYSVIFKQNKKVVAEYKSKF